MEATFDAILKFKNDLYKRTGLELVIKKSKAYMKDIPRLRKYIASRPDLKDFSIGAMEGIDTDTTQTDHGCGVVAVGVPVGSDHYKTNHMSKKSEFLEKDLQIKQIIDEKEIQIESRSLVLLASKESCESLGV